MISLIFDTFNFFSSSFSVPIFSFAKNLLAQQFIAFPFTNSHLHTKYDILLLINALLHDAHVRYSFPRPSLIFFFQIFSVGFHVGILLVKKHKISFQIFESLFFFSPISVQALVEISSCAETLSITAYTLVPRLRALL